MPSMTSIAASIHAINLKSRREDDILPNYIVIEHHRPLDGLFVR